ncbi:sensor histidine kinase [Lentibacillus salicampi]|uniref:histidine kinase n=1 Tax=Lentibacillus salicampi TaxID=175306 RepID=A0A4Y9AA96_9BACI|nr:HAMP domain-containing sensor histidine kinase [Lentibacillus salicampi]TFJ92375.1 HAMP domain-containing histidine kinase [Lentibacillus salicampi]
MKNNSQKKLLLHTVSICILSIITLILFVGVLYVLHHLGLLPLWVNKQILLFRINFRPDLIPVLFTVTILFLLVFMLYHLLLSKRWFRNFDRISQGTKEMAKGNFDYKIPVYSKDELGKLAAYMNQISEQLERALSEERNAIQAKNELITNVSHDLRTPLTSIIGYLRLIDEDRYKDEVELRHYTAVAFDKSKRLERMVNDLFEYTRVNFGEIRLDYSEIDLIELLTQCTTQFIPLLREMDVEIDSQFPEGGLKVLADGDKLARVFENLIANGIKYGKEGKSIDLKAYKEGTNAVVEVINYGIPIPQADLPHLFDRFYRVEKSRSTFTGGSGLGLAISKGIVERHNGSIEAASADMKTIFRVALPLK